MPEFRFICHRGVKRIGTHRSVLICRFRTFICKCLQQVSVAVHPNRGIIDLPWLPWHLEYRMTFRNCNRNKPVRFKEGINDCLWLSLRTPVVNHPLTAGMDHDCKHDDCQGYYFRCDLHGCEGGYLPWDFRGCPVDYFRCDLHGSRVNYYPRDLHGCQNLNEYDTDGIIGKTVTFLSSGLL